MAGHTSTHMYAPAVPSLASLWMKTAGQRLATVCKATDAYQKGLQIPPDAPDMEDNGYACVVWVLLKVSLKPTSLLCCLMRSEYPAGCISSLNTGRTVIINFREVIWISQGYLSSKANMLDTLYLVSFSVIKHETKGITSTWSQSKYFITIAIQAIFIRAFFK